MIPNQQSAAQGVAVSGLMIKSTGQIEAILPVPCTGAKTFERQLRQLTIGEIEGVAQLSKFVAPGSKTRDEFGLEFAPGELQRRDFEQAQTMFAYPRFLRRVFAENAELFWASQARIYQFQRDAGTFVYGLLVTDSSNNLVDFCVDTHRQEKRRSVLIALMRSFCTPESVNRRIFGVRK
jgi:hypothetical protein